MADDEDKPRDFPFDAMVRQAQELIRMGIDVYQRFNCIACGHRNQVPEPNIFFEERDCDKCHEITNIKLRGCNYMVRMIFEVSGKPRLGEESDGNDERSGEDSDHNAGEAGGRSQSG